MQLDNKTVFCFLFLLISHLLMLYENVVFYCEELCIHKAILRQKATEQAQKKDINV